MFHKEPWKATVLMLWKQLNTMQWSNCWGYQKLSLRGASSTDRNDGTSVYVLKEATLKGIKLLSL
jgi:hypothetical protein